MTAEHFTIACGSALLALAALGGGIAAKDFTIPRLSTITRVLSGVVGAVLVLVGLFGSSISASFRSAGVPAVTPSPQTSPTIPPRASISVFASSFSQPLNVALGGPSGIYGEDVLLNGPPYTDQPNRATFEFDAGPGGAFLLKARYASATARPVSIELNGLLAMPNTLAAATGCWEPACQRLLSQGQVALRPGRNVMRIARDHPFPHIHSFVFEPVD